MADEQPIIPDEIEFPAVGVDGEPTQEMIESGRVGNGAWDFNSGAVAIAYHERYEAKKEAEDQRLEHFNEEAKNALSEAVRLHSRVIAFGHDIMDKIEAGEKVNGAMLSLLNKALSSSKELTDRSAGKARTSTDTTGTVSGLAFLIGDGG